jgi:Domain of unknown function (DUF4430)
MKKFFVFWAAIFLLAAGCNKAQPETVNKPVSESVNKQVSKSADQPGAASKANPSVKTPTKQAPVALVQPSNAFTVYEIVDGSELNQPNYQASSTENAFDLLSVTHTVAAKNYGSGMGEFVLSIDGVAPDGKHFWEFFVNGKSSNVGASSYILKAGDRIEWKISTINNSGE